MLTNELLIVLLLVAAVALFLMKGRLDRLSKDMQGQAMVLFNSWKQREYDTVRREQGDVARLRQTVSFNNGNSRRKRTLDATR